MPSIKRAILSVSNLEGILDFARGLKELGVEIFATDGTARFLRRKGVEVSSISDLTGQKELLEGRVKTLHSKIHAAILALRDRENHLLELRENKIEAIDMVVVNLYPFEDVIAKEEVPVEEAIENIDIGGVALIRSAAKNSKSVAVVVNPSKYEAILQELRNNQGNLKEETTEQLALEAFQYTSSYDSAIYNYLWSKRNPGKEIPDALRLRYEKILDLRYGENPHQKAAFYKDPMARGVSVATSDQLHGRTLSFNNVLDLDAALRILMEFHKPTAVVIKHTNPCGVASSDSISEAYRIAEAADSKSAYGSVVGLNRKVDVETAMEISKHFVEAVIAPDFDTEALEILKRKKNIRLLRTNRPIEKSYELEFMKVHGGLLVQTTEFPELEAERLKVVTKKKPTEDQIRGMLFASKIIRHIKSNSIILVKGERTVGVGAGQMSRVDASMLAGYKAGAEAKGSVLASDAFFPFRDGVDEAAKVGVAAILQPGGSIRDEEVIAAADEHGIAMVFSGVRMFKH